MQTAWLRQLEDIQLQADAKTGSVVEVGGDEAGREEGAVQFWWALGFMRRGGMTE